MKYLLLGMLISTLCSCQTPWYKLKVQNHELQQSLLGLEEENAELRAQLDKAGIQITASETKLKRMREAEAQREKELREIEGSLKGTGVTARIENGQAILTLPNQVFFASGRHNLTKEGLKSLGPVAKLLKDQYKDFRISVEGHTDSDPIVRSKDRYQDNYQLSAERARSVINHLEKSGIAKERLKGAFHGANQPVAPNAKKEGKKKNRRVEIILLK